MTHFEVKTRCWYCQSEGTKTFRDEIPARYTLTCPACHTLSLIVTRKTPGTVTPTLVTELIQFAERLKNLSP